MRMSNNYFFYFILFFINSLIIIRGRNCKVWWPQAGMTSCGAQWCSGAVEVGPFWLHASLSSFYRNIYGVSLPALSPDVNITSLVCTSQLSSTKQSVFRISWHFFLTGTKWLKGFHETSDTLILIDHLKCIFDSWTALCPSLCVANETHCCALTVITRWSGVNWKWAGQDVGGVKRGKSVSSQPLVSPASEDVQEWVLK